jgi:hypothetical protein
MPHAPTNGNLGSGPPTWFRACRRCGTAMSDAEAKAWIAANPHEHETGEAP